MLRRRRSEKTIGGAAFLGNLEMVKYCVENQCPMDADACAFELKERDF